MPWSRLKCPSPGTGRNSGLGATLSACLPLREAPWAACILSRCDSGTRKFVSAFFRAFPHKAPDALRGLSVTKLCCLNHKIL